MRIVALLACRNERRFVGPCIEHLREHGVETYLIDNDSTDETVQIAERYAGDGVIGVERLAHDGKSFQLRAQLARKQELAREIDADWFIHLDADEIRLPPPGRGTLAESLAAVDAEGFNAVNFLELSFLPTRENPDHDHPDFQRTLRTYYPLLPEFPTPPQRLEGERRRGPRVEGRSPSALPRPAHVPGVVSDEALPLPQRPPRDREVRRPTVPRGGGRKRVAWVASRDLGERHRAARRGAGEDLARRRRPGCGRSAKTPLPGRAMGLAGPIVVGGCHRSGTSLVRRLLDAHPRIHCGPEVKLMLELHEELVDPDPLAHLRFIGSARSLLPDEELLATLGAALVEIHERAARNAGKRRWADKAPENIVHLDSWRRLPIGDEWVVLHVLRNPLDTIASMQETPFPLTVPSGLEARIDHYLRYTEAGAEFGREEPGRYVRLFYEDLVGDPERSVAELMERLGEEPSPAQLDFNRAAHQTGLEDPKVAATTAVLSAGVGRWRGVLAPRDAERVLARTASLCTRIGGDSRWRAAMRDAQEGAADG